MRVSPLRPVHAAAISTRGQTSADAFKAAADPVTRPGDELRLIAGITQRLAASADSRPGRRRELLEE